MLAHAQEGDEAAFALLWRDLNPPLLRYLGMGGDPADDVAAETWASVVKGLRRFHGEEVAWRAWVFTVARRRAVDAARRRARLAKVESSPQGWPAEAVPDPADLVLGRLDTDAALRLVATLSPLQAEVVALRVLTGLPVEQVATIVGRSPGAVRVAAHRGLKRLEQVLLEERVTDARPQTL